MKSKVRMIDWLVLIVLAIIWGSSYILMKKALVAFEPLQVSTLRLSISSLILSPLLIPAFRTTHPSKFKYILIVALFGSAIPAILYPISLTRIDSAIAGIINSLVPLFTLIIGFFFFRIATDWSKIVGVLLGLVGATLLITFKADGAFRMDYQYALLAVIATICYGTNTNIIKAKLQDVHPAYLTAMMFLFIGLPSFIYLITTDIFEVIINHERGWSSFLFVFILAFFGSAVSLVLFNNLVQRTSALFATTVTYLMPLVAIIWGISDKEVLGYYHLFGLVLILSSVYLVNRSLKNQ